MLKRLLWLGFVFVIFSPILSQTQISKESQHWVDSIMQTLTLQEKIAQCLMPAIYPKDTSQVSETLKMIKETTPGGIIIFQGGPKQVALLVNKMQGIAKVPILMGIDGEWGVAMRLDSVLPFSRQLTLGASENDSLVYLMGVCIAQQLNRLGIHTNFSPVVDINNNPLNPVIGSRSLGSDKELVTRKAIQYMKALQDNKIIAVAKHFPGHGDTELDSHTTLPIIPFSKERLDTFELYPFIQLIKNGLMGIMNAHISVPAYDNSKLPASLSTRIVDSLLIKTLQFEGLIFTDALNMKGAQNGSSKAIITKAFLAGNDILLMPDNYKEAIDTLLKAVKAGIIDENVVNQKCRKILFTKFFVGLNKFNPIDTSHLISDLNSFFNRFLRKKIYESSLTLLSNHDNLLPLKRLDTLRIAIVALGDTSSKNAFKENSLLYSDNFTFFALSKNANDSQFYNIYQQLSSYNLVITLLLNTDMRVTRRYGVTDQQINYLELIAFNHPTILCLFGSPYILNNLQGIRKMRAILLAYEDNTATYEVAAQAVFGGIPVKGKLPVSGISFYPYRWGLNIDKPIRVKYTFPEEVGIKSNQLIPTIDSVIQFAIKQRAIPGCVVYLAKDNKVFFYKAYGSYCYDSLQMVTTSTIYDIASITKIVATNSAIMKLYEEKEIKLNDHVYKYIPKLKKTASGKLIISDILTHQAQLPPVIDIYSKIFKCNNHLNDKKNSGNKMRNYSHCQLKSWYFYSDSCEEHPLKVADGLYVSKHWKDSILFYIKKMSLLSRKEYVYSDVGFILLQKTIESVTKKTLSEWFEKEVSQPLQASTLNFIPLKKYEKKYIAPTEKDTFFRKQVIQGTVHDPVAAMMGGVAGHAGLFSNANDLGKFMHMLLNEGTYGGYKFFEPSTINLFTSAPFLSQGNRRGLGFDKPQPDTTKASPVSRYCSQSSFGHTGFTGTMAWVDPQYRFVFIFLSNRTYPYANANKLAELNIRTKIQDVVYQFLNKD